MAYGHPYVILGSRNSGLVSQVGRRSDAVLRDTPAEAFHAPVQPETFGDRKSASQMLALAK